MYKTSYYYFNKEEILQKTKERYSKENVAWVLFTKQRKEKKNQKIDTKTCQKKKKTRLKSTKEKDISNWFSTKKKHFVQYKNEWKDTKIWQY